MLPGRGRRTGTPYTLRGERQHWSQVIYQLGYAMTHCLIDHLNPSESHAVPWAEELISEACALLLLHLRRIIGMRFPFLNPMRTMPGESTTI